MQQIEIINKYFPKLTINQQKQFAALNDLYVNWNDKINVISRKDINNLYEHHILHSLSIAKLITFTDESNILDVGTGGGLPGIPLAILFPNVHFYLIDGIGKKIKVASEIAKAIELSNVTINQKRVEDEKEKFDFIISRAVMPLDKLIKLTRKNISIKQCNALPNGLICLKGGDIETELKVFKNRTLIYDLHSIFEEDFFITKKIIYVSLI